jgi:hypothetical protein
MCGVAACGVACGGVWCGDRGATEKGNGGVTSRIALPVHFGALGIELRREALLDE